MSPVPVPARARPRRSHARRPSRGRSHAQIGDIVVDFGYAGRESVEPAITEARGRRPAHGRGPRRARRPDRRTSSRGSSPSASGVDHVDLNAFRVDMSRRQPAAPPRPRGATRPSPSASSTTRTLLVAMVDPGNVLAIDDISLMTGHDVRPAAAAQEDVGALIGAHEPDRRHGRRGGRRPTRAPEVVDLRESADERARSSSSSTRSSRRASTRAPPTSTSSPSAASCSSASASTACWPRRRASRAASSPASSRASRSCPSSTSPSAASRRTAAPR